jgi:serine/threonine-protein kinase
MSEPRPHTGPVILGSVLGSYRIQREISTGGMGTVFRAEHVLLGRAAAVKVLRPELTTDDELVQRFVTEAKAVTACKHPGIVEVYDFGYTEDGRAFIVMELLEGESLGQRLARIRLTEAAAAAIAYGIASALKAAHKVGVIHRDLKPDNVFLVPDPDGGPDRTKVLDFGIAKLADPLSRASNPGSSRFSRPSGFDDLAPTLPPDHRALELGNETKPELVPDRRSAIPIVAGVITVLAIAGGGLTYAMLRGGRDAPAPGGSLSAPAPVASPAATPPLTPTPVPRAAPTATPDRPVSPAAPAEPTTPSGADGAGKPSVAGTPGRTGRHVPRGAPAGHVTTKPTDPTDAPGSGPVTRPAPDTALPDRAIEVIRDIRQVDPLKPGEHTPDGSPMESTLDIGKKPPKPVAADPPRNVLPSAAPPKDPSPP